VKRRRLGDHHAAVRGTNQDDTIQVFPGDLIDDVVDVVSG
jgi:hypothetical protein